MSHSGQSGLPAAQPADPARRALDAALGVIQVTGLTKTFGTVRAVDNLSFTVRPGRVTGFLGPNGAGKTTTLRLLLGLATPDSGTATISGRPYAAFTHPTRHVGAALEAASFHPGRTARDHLRVYAPQVGVPDARCDEVLDLVGLTPAANRRVKGFSLGMRQRLALATTLLGEPAVLLLDEPANGLDPEGIAWLRHFLRYLAAQGRTVLVSSHVLSEVEQTVDDVVIIANGRLRHASSLAELAALARPATRISSPDVAGLAELVDRFGWRPVTRFSEPGVAVVSDHQPAEVGAAAHRVGLELHELASSGRSLESLFFALTEPTADQRATVSESSGGPAVVAPEVPGPGSGGVR